MTCRCGVYTRWDITKLGDGKARLRMETNDDNDDGWPDGEVAVWERDMSLGLALQMAGQKSHTGYYGQPVDVYVDGEKV